MAEPTFSDGGTVEGRVGLPAPSKPYPLTTRLEDIILHPTYPQTNSQYTYTPSFHSVGRLYRGLVPPLLLEAPKRAVKFAANDFWGTTFLDLAGEKKMTQNISVLTGAAAGATESFVVVPFELVKIRLQDKNSVYKGPMDVVRQTVAKEGLLGLYAGMESTFWRRVCRLSRVVVED